MDQAASHVTNRDAGESGFYAMIEQLEILAEAGQWDEVEALTVRLQLAIMDVPLNRRRSALLAAQRSVDKVALGAKSAHQALSGKLRELSRGKAAKKAYELR